MSLFRSNIDNIEGYVPGEQPQETGWIKLNTNENPYPTSPSVIEAIKSAAQSRLNIYPDPLSRRFCQLVADQFNVEPDCVLPANGSDENLTILMRTFVDPGELVTYPYPSYILYETLADIQGAKHQRLSLNADWSWDFSRHASAIEQSKLMLIPNPNSPSGTRWSDDDLKSLIPPQGVLVLDEAYGDFSDAPHRGELLKDADCQRVIMTRTLSKSYSLAGIRVGFAIGDPALIHGMRKAKDSYNCNTLSMAAATAAIEDRAWMEANVAKIRTTRARLASSLAELGFAVTPSQANFVWVTHPAHEHRNLYENLKAKKILVRYMSFPNVESPTGQHDVDGIRITIGTDEEIDGLLATLQEIV